PRIPVGEQNQQGYWVWGNTLFVCMTRSISCTSFGNLYGYVKVTFFSILAIGVISSNARLSQC
ncbi:hypothetical protein ACT4UT_22980, partial [Bacillus sp. B-TM1]